MSAPTQERRTGGGGLAPAFAAVRVRLALVIALLALAAVGWWWTVRQMRGMDEGPWTGLGTLGWFLGIWVVMMAAMMFPSVAPTVALFSRMTKQRSPLAPLLFAAGYELSPLKNVCLGKCRSPLGFLLGAWRNGRWGALRMGAKHGAWCVGCCWALMASLFALGVMSVAWMAFVAGLIAVEKTLPWRRVATCGTAVLLLTLGVLLLAAPDVIPALTVPASGQMNGM
jgi:predicted metal-binding membrane protein